jgi:glutamate synthase domain-containing protein 1
MASMLQAMKHRGGDSAGFALYGRPLTDHHYVMRVKFAEQKDLDEGVRAKQEAQDRKKELIERLTEMDAKVESREDATEYASRIVFSYGGQLKNLADYIEDIENVEVLSLGSALELVKDLGDAEHVSSQYGLGDFEGTHAIGHTRMATESDVDIRSAHPFWAYPYSDISVVHNGQLTNYWSRRRELEREGHRFTTDCDSELIAVYLADLMEKGVDLHAALEKSIDELDGVFTYLVATRDALGMAKDTMAAKPLVLYEGDDCIAMASEEVSIRRVFPKEIDTVDPYEGEVCVWHT